MLCEAACPVAQADFDPYVAREDPELVILQLPSVSTPCVRYHIQPALFLRQGPAVHPDLSLNSMASLGHTLPPQFSSARITGYHILCVFALSTSIDLEASFTVDSED